MFLVTRDCFYFFLMDFVATFLSSLSFTFLSVCLCVRRLLRDTSCLCCRWLPFIKIHFSNKIVVWFVLIVFHVDTMTSQKLLSVDFEVFGRVQGEFAAVYDQSVCISGYGTFVTQFWLHSFSAYQLYLFYFFCFFVSGVFFRKVCIDCIIEMKKLHVHYRFSGSCTTISLAV